MPTSRVPAVGVSALVVGRLKGIQVQHFFGFAEKNISFGKYESSTEFWDGGIAEFRAANILRTGGEWKGGTEKKTDQQMRERSDARFLKP